MEIVVVRHGETQWNREGRIQGGQDRPLTLEGVRQAEAVSDALRDTVLQGGATRFWTSPLPRAVQTASLLADSWKVAFAAFSPDERLRELSFGCWEGLTKEQIRQEDPQGWKNYCADRWHVAPGGGESRAQLEIRLRHFLSGLDSDTRHVLVTHSVCLHVLRRIFSGVGEVEALAYGVPQTTAFRLYPGLEIPITPSAAVLQRFGCVGPGTVPAM